MTVPPPRYRFVYAVTDGSRIHRGNVKAHTEAEVRSILAVNYSPEAAQRAEVRMAFHEELRK